MNVVKVGHKQVVSLIRQGGNRLLMKVVSVTRKPESEEVVRKKGKDEIILTVPCNNLTHCNNYVLCEKVHFCSHFVECDIIYAFC